MLEGSLVRSPLGVARNGPTPSTGIGVVGGPIQERCTHSTLIDGFFPDSPRGRGGEPMGGERGVMGGGGDGEEGVGVLVRGGGC